jgi:hypothetical protein
MVLGEGKAEPRLPVNGAELVAILILEHDVGR